VEKKDCGPFEYYEQFMKLLSGNGVLLGVADGDGKFNAMTIGWCQVGIIWGMPVCSVLVRPSRHTYTCLEEIRQFTVNVGGVSDEALKICGTKTGRDNDKLKLAGVTAQAGKLVKAPIINECTLHYECAVMHYNDVQHMNLKRIIEETFYPSGNFHRIYFGKVLACYGQLK
jgi:flavin reductase (DIM6/NTAB) family NADH-FMN oxidoreductase RutF